MLKDVRCLLNTQASATYIFDGQTTRVGYVFDSQTYDELREAVSLDAGDPASWEQRFRSSACTAMPRKIPPSSGGLALWALSAGGYPP